MSQGLVCVLVGSIAFLAATAYGQNPYVTSITSIGLNGGSSGSTGRLNAQVLLNNSLVSQTAVCDSVDFITATFICQKLGYLFASDAGTVSLLQLSLDSTSTMIGNLTCHGPSFGDCTYELRQPNSCLPSNNAAISCMLTAGEVAGIAIGVFLGLLLLFCIPIIVCCCCCCGLCACLSAGTSSSYNKM